MDDFNLHAASLSPRVSSRSHKNESLKRFNAAELQDRNLKD